MSAPIKAIAFDAYGTLFDVYCMTTLAEVLFPDHGAALTTLWREKQLNYSHIRTLSGRYKPFWEVTADALVYATTRLGLELTDEKKRRLMNQYACLDPFPENRETLVAIRDLGLPLAVLSNGNRSMLEIGLRFSALADYFDTSFRPRQSRNSRRRGKSTPSPTRPSACRPRKSSSFPPTTGMSAPRAGSATPPSG